jgi:hypothetical protein
VTTFIRSNNVLTLAILWVSGINNETGAPAAAINTSALLSQEVILWGQVLTLRQWDASTWIWDGGFELFLSDKKPSTAALIPSKKTTIIDIPACITQMIKAQYEQRSDDSISLISKFDTADLQAVVEVLWDNVKSCVTLIPARSPTATYPCRDAVGKCCANSLNEGLNLHTHCKKVPFCQRDRYICHQSRAKARPLFVLSVQGTCDFKKNRASRSTSYSRTKDEYLWEIAATCKCCASKRAKEVP